MKPKSILPIQAGMLALDKILSHVSPVEALKIIFTPDNLRALGEGLAKGAVEAAKEK